MISVGLLLLAIFDDLKAYTFAKNTKNINY